MLPLVARRADVWHGFGGPGTVARKSRLLDDLAERAGRDPASIRRAVALSLSEPWDDVLANAEAFASAGVGHLTVSWPSEGQRRFDEFVERVMPEVRALGT